ncbi:galactosylceramide sulfotransferase-like [Clavelina lepadiformis]|uniref:galactosylceramide sulfotransferase-like n=1 Tax=Clavelina lepadiformis TaxID=159417 RepID=UPI0040439044
MTSYGDLMKLNKWGVMGVLLMLVTLLVFAVNERVNDKFVYDTIITATTNDETDIILTTNQNEPSTTQAVTCEKWRHVVYIKTHKTGSTTAQKAISRFGDKGFKKMPRPRCTPFGGGYPGRFNFDFTPSGKFDVIDGHFRYDPVEFQRHMPEDTKYVTIIREPWSHFQSSFNFYKPQGKNGPQCHDSPINYVTKGRDVDVRTFVTMAEKELGPHVAWHFRFKNYQGHDLGLDPMMQDDVIIDREIRKLDDSLDLVMIMEYMDESFILLKKEFCMDWKDINLSGRNGRRYEKTALDANQQEAFDRLEKVDIALYKHFNATFWKKVDAYGRQQMAQDVATLRSLRKSQKIKTSLQKEPGYGPRQYKPTTKLELTARLKCFGAKASKVADYMLKNAGGCYEEA